MTAPIRPEDIAQAKTSHIPPVVIAAFNAEIAAHFTNGRAVVHQLDVLERICSAANMTRSAVFERGWLNVEEIYRAAGWDVVYDRPAYNEAHPATFEFRVTGNRAYRA